MKITVKELFLRCLLVGFILFLVFVGWLIYTFNFVLTGPRFGVPFAEAHQRAVKTFVDGKGFGIRRFREMEYFNERSVEIERKVWDFEDLSLIGASSEYGERYFEGDHWGPPLKGKLGEAQPRLLDPAESKAIKILREGRENFVILREAHEGAELGQFEIKVMAPIFAEESCLKCHESHAGELLGAFEYRLTRAKEVVKSGAD